MLTYIRDCNVNEVDDNNIIYVIEYDNGAAYPEDQINYVEAVFSEYNDIKKFMDYQWHCTGYELVKNKRECIEHCLDTDVAYLKVMREEWHSSDADDDYYDPVGYYIVRAFNRITGYELFDIVEVIKRDE